MSKKVHVTLLGFTVPDGMMRIIIERDEILQLQTHKFAWSLARAMRLAGANVQLISALPVSRFMQQTIFRGERFLENGFPGHTLGFINLAALKHITRGISCALVARREIRRHRTEIIVVHGVHSPFLWFAAVMRKRNRKFVVVLTDPPGVVLPSDGLVTRLLKRMDVWLIKAALKRADGVIGLTQGLIQDFAPSGRSLVLPGFLDYYLEDLSDDMPIRSGSDLFHVAYAGGLSVAYGVDRLIDAVTGITSIPIQLHLYGKGELVSRIEALTISDRRIRYGGSMSPGELAKHLRTADLLVNPRPSDQDFVRYSFPSKLIEYMALGVPVLSTRLPGIPDEYLECMMIADVETDAGLRNAILEFAAMPAATRTRMAREARLFIIKAASEATQSRKIASYFHSLMQVGS